LNEGLIRTERGRRQPEQKRKRKTKEKWLKGIELFFNSILDMRGSKKRNKRGSFNLQKIHENKMQKRKRSIQLWAMKNRLFTEG